MDSRYIVDAILRKINLSTLWVKKFVSYRLSDSEYKNIDIRASIKSTIGDFTSFSADYLNDSAQVINSAEEIIGGKIRVLSYQSDFKKGIDWHTDFVSGFTWPKGKYFRSYIQVDLSNNADVKVPRELSRSHHLLVLGEAYLLTKDEKFTLEFIAQIENWIDENPFMYSINWGCTMDVAIRVVNWVYAYNMFSDSKHLTDNFNKIFTQSLFRHGWFIFRNPERTLYNNGNHYLSNLAGQLLLGLIFINTLGGRKWFENAKFEIFREIRLQVLPSGVIYEKTTNYIRLVNEIFLFLYLLLKRNAHFVPQDIVFRIEKQFDFARDATKPHGKQPIIGDQDDGMLLPFEVRVPMDSRHLLSIASLVFKRSDFKSISSRYYADCFFYLGPDSKRHYQDLMNENHMQLLSVAYPDAGFFIMRHNDIYMFINNSGPAKYFEHPRSKSSHTHADLLSFELAIGNSNVFVDPGAYVYTSNPQMRNLFRSTYVHNTAIVDGQDQYVLDTSDIFSYKTKAFPVSKWESNQNYDLFSGTHDGYARLSDPVIHRRTIRFDKKGREFYIEDNFDGKGVHDLRINFHIGDGFEATHHKEVKQFSIQLADGGMVLFEYEIPANKSAIKLIGSFISHSYGMISDSSSIEIKLMDIKLPFKNEVRIKIVVP